ncbi:murein L,D-transpeptidase [Myxococcus sp. RHSTA-1-4]|uniref:L,D-transpeptidase family protein n=1 Tax=Myxococcus sp. RHSTA-1-4 TaxID=2874601 RepID=UPI001CBE5E43|nr:L,D-transpeptidase family protein [Myxococcus sp. RHSTA-1-4]MBZ4415373.1 L,D-transpeptidase family protein [Myxococcus sp. RHSTA-1-4]
MRSWLVLLCCWLLVGVSGRAAAGTPPSFEAEVRAQARQEPKETGRALLRFYEAREFQPAWFSEDGRARLRAHEYLDALGNAEAEGLSPERYHRSELDSALQALEQGDSGEDAWRRVELRLTSSFLTYASHLASGQVSSRRVRWQLGRPEPVDLPAVLEGALASGDLAGTLRSLSPRMEGFVRLREALARYRAIAATGGWPLVPRGALLAPGALGPRVAVLRERLRVTGDLAPAPTRTGPPGVGTEAAEDFFDAELETAVRHFQQRHGLEVDGKVGRDTLAALRVPVEARITQLRVNLERWRWLPDELEPLHVAVNLPAFELVAVAEGRAVLWMPVVIGRQDWSTPVFTARLQSLVLNPSWHVPRDITAEEVLPRLQEDPGAAERLGLTVLDRATGVEVAPWTVDWRGLGDGALPYRFMQLPGASNPMGSIKFVLPNPHGIYLHGTPEPSLFTQVSRVFSHGCIRVAEPLLLADFLLRGHGGWTLEALAATGASGMPLRGDLRVELPEPVPVYLLYWTAFMGPAGQVEFRPDIYGRDREVRRALPASDRRAR